MKRRLLAFLMCAVMIIGIFPGAVFAEEDIPDVNETPVSIEEPEDTPTEKQKEDNDVDPEKPAETPEVPETPKTPEKPQTTEGTTEEDEESEETPEKSEEDNNAFTPLNANDGNPVVVQDWSDDWNKVDWKLFNGYNGGYCKRDSRGLSPTVTLDSNTWSIGEKKDISTVQKGTVYITPPAGYYVRQVVICCNDEEGYNCQTNAQGRVIRTNYSITDGSKTVELPLLNASGYWHPGKGYPSHMMIWLEECPNPVYVGYNIGSLTGFNEDKIVEGGNIFVYPYTEGTPEHTVLDITSDLKEFANINGKEFTGWELKYYSNYNDGIFSGSIGAGNTETAKIGQKLYLHTHAQLVAQWKDAETAEYTIEHKLITGVNDKGEITSTKPMSEINPDWEDTTDTAVVGSTITVSDHAIKFTEDDINKYEVHSCSPTELNISNTAGENVATIYYKLKQYEYTINHLLITVDDEGKIITIPLNEIPGYATTLPATTTITATVVDNPINVEDYKVNNYAWLKYVKSDPPQLNVPPTDGNNTANIYYQLEQYPFTIHHVEKDTDEKLADDTTGSLEFGTTIKVEDYREAIDGYTFDSAEPEIIKIDVEKNEATIYYTKKAEEVEKFRVYYKVDGKLYSISDEIAPGTKVDVLAKLRDKTNYTFKGWYLESPKDLTIRFGSFTMPKENVIFYGYYEFDSIDIPIIKDGYIKIEKNLIAPNDFSGSTVFTFDIYKDGNDDDDYYTTVKVAAGDFEKIKVPTGVYYIYEVDAEEEGYTLISASDAQNNRIVVEGGKTRTVTFKNVYTEEAKLETEDHFGYIIGYPDGTVKPQGNITRAEIATIFFRLLTDDARDYYWSQTNDFTDVSADDWFNNAISTLANAGILSGYEDGSFRPNAAITRAELVKIAVSFYDSDAAEDSGFSDVEGHWADMFINAAYGRGFISGYGDGTFKPDQAVTRAEAMKIINRTLDRHPDADHLLRGMITFSDNMDKDAWYYAEVQEATNSHEYEWTSYELEDWTELLPIRDWAALEKAYSDAYAG